MRFHALAVLMLALMTSNCGAANAIVGSGKIVDREEKVSDFTSIEAGSAFNVAIHRGEVFKVTVSADDNLLDYVKVTKKDRALRLELAEDVNLNNPHLKADVVMPELEGVRLDGASHVTIDEFKCKTPFKLDLNGASNLKGAIEADEVTIHVDGASTAELKGAAKSATLTADGASTLKLDAFTIEKANAKLNGAASAKLNVKSSLDYHIDGASNLSYAGHPATVRGDTSGASAVVRK